MPGTDDEPDLGALVARLVPQLIALEGPILAAAGFSMWEYAIVGELASGDAVSQVELSRRTRRDPTRLGRHLDDLVTREVIVIQEWASDRRQRAVRLTADGRAQYERVKRSVRAVEDDFLRSALSATEAALLRSLLTRLTTQ